MGKYVLNMIKKLSLIIKLFFIKGIKTEPNNVKIPDIDYTSDDILNADNDSLLKQDFYDKENNNLVKNRFVSGQSVDFGKEYDSRNSQYNGATKNEILEELRERSKENYKSLVANQTYNILDARMNAHLDNSSILLNELSYDISSFDSNPMSNAYHEFLRIIKESMGLSLYSPIKDLISKIDNVLDRRDTIELMEIIKPIKSLHTQVFLGNIYRSGLVLHPAQQFYNDNIGSDITNLLFFLENFYIKAISVKNSHDKSLMIGSIENLKSFIVLFTLKKEIIFSFEKNFFPRHFNSRKEN